MSTTTHTPGPWRIGDAGKTIFGARDENPSPVTIAQIAPSSRTTLDEKDANARLIASALESLLAHVRQHNSEQTALGNCIVWDKSIDAALAAAKGQP